MGPAVTTPSITLEVCVDSVESALNAVRAGADRLEICANLGVGGGTTPSLGLLSCIQKAVRHIPLMIMVRPRTGDFLYSDSEIQTMLEDIRIFKECGVRGIVFGVLTKDGRVDAERMKILIDEILPLEACFHRAIDMTRDVEQSLRDIMEIGGVARILTSGHDKLASNALETLQRVFKAASSLVEEGVWGLSIMPGGGINSESAALIVRSLLPLGLREIHVSGGMWIPSKMDYRRSGMGMGAAGEGEWGVWLTLGENIRKIRNIVDDVCKEFPAQQ